MTAGLWPSWCALWQRNCMMTPSVYREGEASVGWLNRVPPEGHLRCLSRVKGDFHARFLGEGAAATPLPYPTVRRFRRQFRYCRQSCAGRHAAKPGGR